MKESPVTVGRNCVSSANAPCPMNIPPVPSPRERLETVLEDSDLLRFTGFPPSYGRAIWDAVVQARPAIMVHFGVQRGYTAIIAALAMEEVGAGHIKAYDWWEDARVEGGLDEAQIAIERFERYRVRQGITLESMDFFDWIRTPEPCDLFYLDIDNDGDKVRAMYEGLRPQIEQGLPVLFEGGSDARDRHPSMEGKPPIGAMRQLTSYAIIVEDFPSLSRIWNRGKANDV